MLLCLSFVLLWTGLAMGCMFQERYRQQCLTDDTGVPTGAYAPGLTHDGRPKLHSSKELEELEEEAARELTESEDQEAWRQVGNMKQRFWGNYMKG
jgi:hypothetical protein